MPANRKYLSSGGQRTLKISAAILGGYLVAASFHLFLASFPSLHEIVLLTSSFSFFLVWAGLMVVTFLAKNGWKIWLYYLVITGLFSGLIYLIR